MLKNICSKTVTAIMGTALVGTLSIVDLAVAADNPFASSGQDSSGYIMLAESHEKEGKCGEGKCSGEKGEKEGKCGGEGQKEGKCGEGKCSGEKGEKEGKCGGDEAGKESKCGY